MKYFIFCKRVCTQMHCKCYFWKNMKYPIISCIKERNFWSALDLTITYSPLPNENYKKSSVPIVIIKEWHVLLFEISWLVFILKINFKLVQTNESGLQIFNWVQTSSWERERQALLYSRTNKKDKVIHVPDPTLIIVFRGQYSNFRK